MSSNHQNDANFHPWGIDPAVIEAAMQRGRLERSKAFHGLWHTLVSYATGRGHDTASPAQSNGRAARAVAC